MRLGLGVTFWVKGLRRQHLDGIGVYTRQLWQELHTKNVHLCRVGFGLCAHYSHALPDDHTCLDGNFNLQVGYSLLTRQPFIGSSVIERQIDIFHAPDHHIPRLRHTPVIATIMDTIPLTHPEWASSHLRGLKNFAFRQSVQWCERIITISEHSKQDIVQHLHIPEERIDVTPLGVDPSFFERFSQEKIEKTLKKYSAHAASLIFVGTLQPRKNLHRILEAHRRLPQTLRKNHPLLVIGKYGWGDESLRDALNQMQREGFGLWLNNVPDDDLRPLLQSAAALIYPSLYEGFGLPVLEGFASGLPVITSKTSSMPEVAGDAALLINPLDIDELAIAMQRVLEDSHLAADLSRRGLARAREFTWARTAEQTLAVYKRALADH